MVETWGHMIQERSSCSIVGKGSGIEANSISCQAVSNKRTFGTIKRATDQSRAMSMQPRSQRRKPSAQGFGSSFTITHSKGIVPGFDLNLSGPIQNLMRV